MATLTLQLANGQTFVLPKQWILDVLPESLLADALRAEPDLALLPLQQLEVTPAVMQFLVNLSQGTEPSHSLNQTTQPTRAEIEAAHRYLNIPAALVYISPHYDNYRMTLKNWRFNAEPVFKDDDVIFLRYLISKGEPWDSDFFNWAAAYNATKILAFILQAGVLHPAKGRTHALHEAISANRPELVRILLDDPRVNPAIFDNLYLTMAGTRGSASFVKMVLDDGRVDPTARNYEALGEAMDNEADAVVDLFRADPRVNFEKAFELMMEVLPPRSEWWK